MIPTRAPLRGLLLSSLLLSSLLLPSLPRPAFAQPLPPASADTPPLTPPPSADPQTAPAPAPAPAPDPASSPPPSTSPPPSPPHAAVAIGMGYGREHLLGLDLGRLDFAVSIRIPPKASPLGLSLAAHLMPGRTDESLMSYRSELAVGVFVGEGLRAAAHLHANYTMLLRATEQDAFTQALRGNIGAFGAGPDLELALGPFEGGPKLFPTVRGGVDWFPGSGVATWANACLHLQFY